MRPRFMCHVGNSDAGGGFYSALLSASLTDNAGEEADTLELEFDDRLNRIETPREGAILQPFFGYIETGVTSKGLFTVAGIGIEGGARGDIVRVSAKAADFRDELKERMTESFEDTTLKAVLDEVFGRHGLQVEVDPDLAGREIEYLARYNQSAVAFASSLARKYNAVAKPGGGKYVFAKRGKAANVSTGESLPVVTVHKAQCSDWSFDLPPRPRHGRVVGKWFDRDAGKMKFETVSTGGKGPILMLPHPYNSQSEAKDAAEAEGVSQNRKTGTGSFTMPGRPSASAEADVIASGFRPEINGKWRATSVEHAFSRNGGYATRVSVEAPETQKGMQ